ncbi:MAG: phenylalanine 4-monooxygenase [Flavipsychrobacter sp.]|nr:phenylalanine 4-monooxygenase [Flavipsychrobacter sp.]
MLRQTRHIIVGIIDFFHKPFARIIPLQTFRYLACGGSNTVLNIFIDFIAFHYIAHEQDVHIYGNVNIAPEVVAWIIAFAISFPAGFMMSRHIVFPESNLHGKIQLFRYALTTVTFILLTYILIKVFTFCVPWMHQSLRYTIICIITAVLSYISQRKFTFKTIEEEEDEVEEEVVPD